VRPAWPGAMGVALLLAVTSTARAEFFWPWQVRPAPPPVAIPAPAPVPKKPASRPKPKVDAARPDGKGSAREQDAKAEPEAPDLPPPPYEPQLLRLSEIVGALSFLHPLCSGKSEDNWRVRMTTLIEAEASTPQRRERLAGAYNRGFREYGQVYRRCTPAAELAITRFLDEAATLTRDLSSRYGG
jgi:uncharacterized protein (TIGR02301 family)